jgi:hypothetical protein
MTSSSPSIFVCGFFSQFLVAVDYVLSVRLTNDELVAQNVVSSSVNLFLVAHCSITFGTGSSKVAVD